jgi:cytochrome c oxidase subunit 1
MAMAALSALGGGIIANILIQERFAPLLSDTFAVPGYFHFFTVGTVTLTFLGALLYMIPVLTGHRLWLSPLAARLPYVLTVSVYLFGIAGVWAGYAGVPRRVMDFDYSGTAPALWGSLMAAVGIGGLIMVVVGASYVAILAVTALWDVSSGRRVEEFPAASFSVEDSVGQRAWFGPVAVGVLLVGIYVATTGAFQLMQSLPLGG